MDKLKNLLCKFPDGRRLTVGLLLLAYSGTQSMGIVQRLVTSAGSTSTKLQMTATVLKQSTCISDSGGFTTAYVKLKLRLAYRNAGSEVLLIHRDAFSDLGGSRLAMYPEDFTSRKFEYEIILDRFVTGRNSAQKTRPGREFARLKAGQTLMTEGETSLILALDQPEQARLLDGKTRYLQVWVWNEDDPLGLHDQEESLRARWMPYGYLWTHGALAQPVPITLPVKSSLDRCK